LIRKAFEKVKTGMLLTVAAVIGTAPITALVFKQFSLIAPVTNLFLTPIVCFVILPLGFFTGFSAVLLDLPLMPLNWITDHVTGLLLQLVRIFSALPYASFRIHDPPVIMTACYYAALFLIIKTGLRSIFKWESVPLLVIIVWYVIIPYTERGDFKVTFLDTGQGEAVQIDLPDNKIMLIDGGTERPDTGRMSIAPFLWSRGIKKIDYVVLTHQHTDHSGGLNYIFKNFDIGEVWLNGRPAYEAEEVFRTIEKYGISYRFLKRGDVLKKEQYTVKVFHPYNGFYANSARGGFSDQNSGSIVLKIESGGVSFLFTGDIEEEAEWDLAHLGKHLKSDIIKVPHHGGRTSSSAEFMNAVNPGIAVISAGRNNRFGHPHYETLQRYRVMGTRIFRTDIDGAITINAGGGSPEITTYRGSELTVVENWRDEVRNLRLLMRWFDQSNP
jgi:competence protein ComEC